MYPIHKLNKTVVILALLAILFLALRLPGIYLPLHQDEWKNVAASETAVDAGKFFSHPPFMQMTFVAGREVFGMDLFRLMPVFFSLATFALLFLVVRRVASKRAALWSVLLFSISYSSVWGSLMMDMDGSALPFLFILAVYSYLRWRGEGGSYDRYRWIWFCVCVFALLGGFLMKLSFIVAVGAIIIEYLWSRRKVMSWKIFGTVSAAFVGFVLLFVSLLYFIQTVYPSFSISFMLTHANQFSDAGGRNFIQIVVQTMKSAYYLSPLLIVPLLFVDRESLKKSRVFFLYIVFGLVFFLVLFDFSRGALDKYLLFLALPLSAICGIILAKATVWRKKWIWIGTGLALILVALNFWPHSVVALYPKTEWFSRVAHGEWNVLTPLTGGSGPMGFYMSFLFIAASFIVSLILGIFGLLRKNWRPAVAVIIVIIGIAYNGVFIDELMAGKINGSSAQVLDTAIAFIETNDQIKKVITYNDIGAGPLSIMGKYGGRFYAMPDNEEGHRKRFAEFDGHYLVVDIPHLYEDGFYGDFFKTCNVIFETSSGKISGKVYECPHEVAQ